VSGQAVGVVVGTGDSAEIGQISKMVNTVSTTHETVSCLVIMTGMTPSVHPSTALAQQQPLL